ncbi:Stk1 family PASTA domain-containing Ser/Thr kinase [Streptomyces fuscigenes]|uniref:Stk1 family PASTA domain-containing Ser/Thr kinase n=1 Tax=Streptomyces fuscigenes TaxID=1528880 RepID=UPI001F42B64B|nr:Stk1 family PASTA domain-containing Ser/Thr kinase [Streptomyces fuscigenes]MCF3964810.1 protein kinase [Streptomyces fuscigenes]
MSQDGAQGEEAGTSLAGGRYQLRSLLGQGGMASVHLAYDSALDRQVAIKTLHSDLGREPSFRERFRREAQAVAKLSHPNIVSVFDTGEDVVDGAPVPYIVMEYVEGQPLGSVLRADIAQYGAMPEEKALKITADVLAALETSHEMGLVHRDIKPGNVMITQRGVVKVMDFGIARAMQSGVTSMTQTGMVVGTPQYLSPEQALGRGVDARSDLYSVGIMLFQLLTGRLPFDADSPLAIAYAHVQEEPSAPSSINRSVTRGADALVARALRKNPNERFPSASAMRDETSRVLPSAGQAGPPVIAAGAPPQNSGSGVASAVFPPVGGGQAPPAAPGPYGTPPPYGHPGQPGPYGTPAPTAPQQGYGYPQAHPAQQGGLPPTPPPYATTPGPASAGGGGGRGKTPLVVAAVVVALAAIGGIVYVLGPGSGGSPDAKSSGGATSSATATAGGGSSPSGAGYRPPEPNRTMEADACTDAFQDYEDAKKVDAPDFRYKDIRSVKACMNKVGWSVKESDVDNGAYADGQVVEQYPAPGDPVDPKSQVFDLKVSTGKPE